MKQPVGDILRENLEILGDRMGILGTESGVISWGQFGGGS